MEKLYTYMMITTVIMILLNLFGYATLTGTIIGKMGFVNPASVGNYENSFMFSYVIRIAFLALAALAVVSLVSKTVSDLPITATMALALLVTLVADLASVILFASAEWERWLLTIVIAPFVYGYIIALYDWVRGKD